MARALSRALGLALACILASSSAVGQDARGEIATDSATYRGVRANAPIRVEHHVRNEGGSDGAGLCVISSIIAAGQHQAIAATEGAKSSTLWRVAKSRPGGYSPDKLRRLVEEVAPEERWASYVGTDSSVLDQLSAQGYAIGATMNTGAQYGYAPIHHMITLAHIDSDWACVVDNNDPGHYRWMPDDEFRRRWIDGGTGWAWVWTDLPRSTASLPDAYLIGAAIVAVVGILTALRPAARRP